MRRKNTPRTPLLEALGRDVVESVQRYAPEAGRFETVFRGADGAPAGADFPIRDGEGYLIFALEHAEGIELPQREGGGVEGGTRAAGEGAVPAGDGSPLSGDPGRGENQGQGFALSCGAFPASAESPYGPGARVPLSTLLLYAVPLVWIRQLRPRHLNRAGLDP